MLKPASTDSSTSTGSGAKSNNDDNQEILYDTPNESIDTKEFLKSYKFISFGHEVIVPRVLCGRPVAMFTFNYICGQAFGSVDYIEIAKRFSVVFLSHVPELSISNRNEVGGGRCLMFDQLYSYSQSLSIIY